jgi:hypothetical protein
VSLRSVILERIALIAHQQDKVLAPLTDDLPLMQSGLDSLCIAILVATMDDELGMDPFATDDQGAFPVTLGDFIRFYENAAA